MVDLLAPKCADLGLGLALRFLVELILMVLWLGICRRLPTIGFILDLL